MKLIVEVKSCYYHSTWFIFHLLFHARQCWNELEELTFLLAAVNNFSLHTKFPFDDMLRVSINFFNLPGAIKSLHHHQVLHKKN